jgi:hypothetical protein
LRDQILYRLGLNRSVILFSLVINLDAHSLLGLVHGDLDRRRGRGGSRLAGYIWYYDIEPEYRRRGGIADPFDALVSGYARELVLKLDDYGAGNSARKDGKYRKTE